MLIILMYLQSLTCYKLGTKQKENIKNKKENKGGRVSTIYIYIYMIVKTTLGIWSHIFANLINT